MPGLCSPYVAARVPAHGTVASAISPRRRLGNPDTAQRLRARRLSVTRDNNPTRMHSITVQSQKVDLAGTEARACDLSPNPW